ncbi:hypothetical protein ABC345_19295 [Shouchella sp. 1P09AA]|uniref:response regulator aspartate phosphatase n=1 Tax=unclassified Shouchella TaxID=2893065 RepID=UPI00399FCD96
MTKTLAAVDVGARIVKWYSCILARSVDEAVLMKEEIKQSLKIMEPDDKILAYYSLVEYRFNMMYYQTTDAEKGNEMIQDVTPTVNESLDHMLRYLYYLVSGQHEYMHGKYRSAIRLLRKAERLLEYVNDDAEEAEFQYYMGISLMYLGHYAYACSYLEESMLTFKRLGYTERVLNSANVLGGIYSVTRNYDLAGEILNDSLFHANNYPLSRVLITYSLGNNAYHQKDYDGARDYYGKIINENLFEENAVTIRAQYGLSKALFRLGENNEAIRNLLNALNKANLYKHQELIIKCNLLLKLFVKKEYQTLSSEIDHLEILNLNHDVETLSEELSHYFNDKGKKDMAFSFMYRAYEAKHKVLSIGVGQD